MFVDLGSHFQLFGNWPPASLELERVKDELCLEKTLLVAERAMKQDAETQLDQERERRHDLVEAGVRVLE